MNPYNATLTLVIGIIILGIVVRMVVRYLERRQRSAFRLLCPMCGRNTIFEEVKTPALAPGRYHYECRGCHIGIITKHPLTEDFEINLTNPNEDIHRP